MYVIKKLNIRALAEMKAGLIALISLAGGSMVCLLVSCTLCVAVRRILIERGRRRRNDHPRALTGYLTLYHHHHDNDNDEDNNKEEEEEELLQEEKECGHHQGLQA